MTRKLKHTQHTGWERDRIWEDFCDVMDSSWLWVSREREPCKQCKERPLHLPSLLTPVVSVSPLCCRDTVSQDALPAECIEPTALWWILWCWGSDVKGQGYSSWQPGPLWTPVRRHSVAGAGGQEEGVDGGGGVVIGGWGCFFSVSCFKYSTLKVLFTSDDDLTAEEAEMSILDLTGLNLS